MKSLHYFMIAILFSSIIGFGVVYAEQPLLKFYNTSDRVLVGKIISSSQIHAVTGDTTQYPNQTRYDIQVEQYYKDPQDFKLVTVYGYAKGIYFSHDPTFDVGDRVFLYLIKKNGFYQIQSPSFKLDNNCDARPMVPLPVLPFESPAISSPAQKAPFDFIDSDGNKRLYYMVNEKIHINFVATNYLPMVKYATLNFLIKTNNDTKLVFNDTKQIMLPACDGNVPISWDFVPENRGSYSVHVNMSSSISMAGEILLFTEPTMQDNFDVYTQFSSVKLDKSPYFPPPLQQFNSIHDPYSVVCTPNLSLVVSTDNIPACVKNSTAVKLWDRNWVNKSPQIYTKYLSPDIMTEFQYKIIDKEKAVQLVQDYVKENNLTSYLNTTDSRFKIVTSLNYELLSSGYNDLLDVDPKTGLPLHVMSPLWANYYKNPQWWSELEKYYLGLDNKRIENGTLVWHVDYRECPNCIVPYPIFMVDAITGKVVLAPSFNQYG
ncbi:MAG TPA: hypothetical protein VFU58_02960 [Candidatus Nitrosotalea sp.]|nr:hypothetical protein [Candidatus Nitrosotalea sp.]